MTHLQMILTEITQPISLVNRYPQANLKIFPRFLMDLLPENQRRNLTSLPLLHITFTEDNSALGTGPYNDDDAEDNVG